MALFFGILATSAGAEDGETIEFDVTPLTNVSVPILRGEMLELKVEADPDVFARAGEYEAVVTVTNRTETSGAIFQDSYSGAAPSFIARIPTKLLEYGDSYPKEYLVSVKVHGVGYQWVEEKIPFTVIDGAAIAFDGYNQPLQETSQGMERNKLTRLKKNSFTYTGHHFTGWTTGGTDPVTYEDEQYVTLSEDLRLFAVWAPNTTYYSLDIIDLTDPDQPVNGRGGTIRGSCTVNANTNPSYSMFECNSGYDGTGKGLTQVYLTAYWTPDYTFLGWYSGETLDAEDQTLQITGTEPLSIERDYSFDLTDEGETKKVCAVFASSGSSDPSGPVDPYDPYDPMGPETHSGTLGELEWTLSLDEWGGNLSITGTGAMPDLDAEKNEAWLAYRDSITYVYISDGITSIGANAFDSCNALSYLSLYGSLETIGEAAFRNCSGLYSIFLPGTLTGIGDNCFSGCIGLEDVYYNGEKTEWSQITISKTGNDSLINMPIQCNDGIIGLPSEGACGDNLTWILDNKGTLKISGSGDMYDYKHYGPWHLSNKEISKVVLEDGVTSIGTFAFYDCWMTEILIPASVTEIGTYAFHGCRLESITIPEGVTSIAPCTFSKSNLTRINIPSSVKSIGSAVFEECYMSNVTIPEGVESLEGAVFMQCYSLKSLSIPHSIKRISGFTVRDCDKLEDIYYNGTKADWDKIEFIDADGKGSLKEKKIRFASYTAYGTCGEDLNWTLDSKGVLMVYGTGAMEDYNEAPAPWAGYRKKIKSVVIENGVTGIGSCAFNECAALTTVKLPGSLLTIGSEAFASCKLSSVTIPFGIETSKKDFFYPDSDQKGHLYHIELPANVTEVGFAAFYGNPFPSDDPDFILPLDLTTVEASAFVGIDARYVWIPDQVTLIGTEAFADCPSLEYIYIPYGCTIVEDALPENTVILGIDGSPAETYGNPFTGLEDPYSGNG